MLRGDDVAGGWQRMIAGEDLRQRVQGAGGFFVLGRAGDDDVGEAMSDDVDKRGTGRGDAGFAGCKDVEL
ncbi:hypothetical protein LBMAG48_20620 [Phycisphaerae bacterium]|nr:hypothetical protein LBMAG48_20620 [Phycisphaerae bacterium]